jgi:hypothetical protein
MSKEELIGLLNDLGIDSYYYSLEDGPFGDGKIILEKTFNHYADKEYEVWNVFSVDRGRQNEKSFYSESEALQDIYDRLKRDQEYRNKH